VTELGEGFWLVEPLKTDRGFLVLVNRGFVPQGWRDTDSPPAEAPVTITGLLRISEPKGAFLRANAPAENRWYSRDVEAISRAQHLSGVAPYFIDAEAPGDRTRPETPESDSARPPVPGLTVVHFRNTHLQYAITWFVLALMALALGVRVARTR
jgi:surfeit locus 1 family protein